MGPSSPVSDTWAVWNQGGRAGREMPFLLYLICQGRPGDDREVPPKAAWIDRLSPAYVRIWEGLRQGETKREEDVYCKLSTPVALPSCGESPSLLALRR